jgi:hypothetical protein
VLASAILITLAPVRHRNASWTVGKNSAGEPLHGHPMLQILCAVAAAWGTEPGGDEDGEVAMDGDTGWCMRPNGGGESCGAPTAHGVHEQREVSSDRDDHVVFQSE